MRLFFACLLSVCLHLLLLFAPGGLPPQAPAKARLQATLQPKPDKTGATTTASADLLATHPLPQAALDAPTNTPPAPAQRSLPATARRTPVRTPPSKLSAAALRRTQAALSKHLFYPPAAVEQGLEGDVVLLLALDERGHILTAEIAKSSGHALLDQAALDAARQIGALPGNPQQTLLPVSFRLQ
jgi:protein TonB